MSDTKKQRLPGRAIETTRATFSQTELATHEYWAHFTLKSPPAAALVHMLCRLAGDDDTVVASQRVLAIRLGVSQITIARALKKAESANYLEIIRLGKTATGACGYRLNSRVHWTKNSAGKTGAAFRATVLASADDQKPTLPTTPPLRRVPVIRSGEIPSAVGPGSPPPSQPDLDGIPPATITSANEGW